MADIQVIVDDVGEVFYLNFRDGPTSLRCSVSAGRGVARQLFHIAYRDRVDVDVEDSGRKPSVDIERYSGDYKLLRAHGGCLGSKRR